jgi:DNA-directed RNA polymerase specialized sigma24 family protein
MSSPNKINCNCSVITLERRRKRKARCKRLLKRGLTYKEIADVLKVPMKRVKRAVELY